MSEIIDLVAFLQGEGLEHLAELFIKNDVLLDLLPELIAENPHDHLKELGVSSMGDRLKVFKAVREKLMPPAPAARQSTPQHQRPPAMQSPAAAFLIPYPQCCSSIGAKT